MVSFIFTNPKFRAFLGSLMEVFGILIFASFFFVPVFLGMNIVYYLMLTTVLAGIGLVAGGWIFIYFSLGSDCRRYIQEGFFIAAVPSIVAVLVFLPHGGVGLLFPLLSACFIAFGSGRALWLGYQAEKKN